MIPRPQAAPPAHTRDTPGTHPRADLLPRPPLPQVPSAKVSEVAPLVGRRLLPLYAARFVASGPLLPRCPTQPPRPESTPERRAQPDLSVLPLATPHAVAPQRPQRRSLRPPALWPVSRAVVPQLAVLLVAARRSLRPADAVNAPPPQVPQLEPWPHCRPVAVAGARVSRTSRRRARVALVASWTSLRPVRRPPDLDACTARRGNARPGPRGGQMGRPDAKRVTISVTNALPRTRNLLLSRPFWHPLSRFDSYPFRHFPFCGFSSFDRLPVVSSTTDSGGQRVARHGRAAGRVARRLGVGVAVMCQARRRRRRMRPRAPRPSRTRVVGSGIVMSSRTTSLLPAPPK